MRERRLSRCPQWALNTLIRTSEPNISLPSVFPVMAQTRPPTVQDGAGLTYAEDATDDMRGARPHVPNQAVPWAQRGTKDTDLNSCNSLSGDSHNRFGLRLQDARPASLPSSALLLQHNAMAIARALLIDPDHDLNFHIASRCVRRATLCGWDEIRRKDHTRRAAIGPIRTWRVTDTFVVSSTVATSEWRFIERRGEG